MISRILETQTSTARPAVSKDLSEQTEIVVGAGTPVQDQRIEAPTRTRPVTAPAEVEEAWPVEEAPRRRSWAWLWWLVLLGLAVGGYYAYPYVKPWFSTATDGGGKAGAAGAARVVPVVTAIAKRGNLNLYLNGLGTVTAFNTVVIRSRVDGELTKIGFTEGEMVKSGDLIAQIDPRPYQVQLTEAEGTLAKDEANLKSAQLDLDRFNGLIANRTITQQQLDAQIALVKQFEGAVKTDQGQIDQANLNIQYCRITAPLSGRIGLRVTDQGNMVHATDPNGLAVIAQLQPIAIIFTIAQDDINRVQAKTANGEKLVVDAYDRDFKTKLASGELVAIDNQVDPTTGTVRLKAVCQNEKHTLFPNQFVNARLLVETLRNVTIVPAAPVQRGPNSTFAYVVKADQTVELRTITIGPQEGDETVVEKGLNPGEILVTDGVDKLQPGTKVSSRVRGESKGGNKSRDAASPGAGNASAPSRGDSTPVTNEAANDGNSAPAGPSQRGSRTP